MIIHIQMFVTSGKTIENIFIFQRKITFTGSGP